MKWPIMAIGRSRFAAAWTAVAQNRLLVALSRRVQAARNAQEEGGPTRGDRQTSPPDLLEQLVLSGQGTEPSQ